jgi:hypothetical protein
MVKGNNLLLNGYEWFMTENRHFIALKKPFENIERLFG